MPLLASTFYWKNSHGFYSLVRGSLIEEGPNQENVPYKDKLPFKLDTIVRNTYP